MTFDPTLQPTIGPARKLSDRTARPATCPASSDEADVVLVLAGDPLRNMLVDLVRAQGYEVQTSRTPLETVHLLEHLKQRVRCAVISSRLPWSLGVWELLLDEYPEIEPVVIEA